MCTHHWVCWWWWLLEIFLLYQMEWFQWQGQGDVKEKQGFIFVGVVYGWLRFFTYLTQETNVKLWKGCSRQVQDSWILCGRCCESWYRYMRLEEVGEENKAGDKHVQQRREKQPEQGWARAVSTHISRQAGPSLCSDVTPCTVLGRRKTHEQPYISPLHTSFFPSATWQKWIFPYGWGSEFLIAGGCYRNAEWVAVTSVCIYFVADTLSPGKAKERWLGEM